MPTPPPPHNQPGNSGLCPTRPFLEAQQPSPARPGRAGVLPGLPLRSSHAGVSRGGGRPRVSAAMSRGRCRRRGRDGRSVGALSGPAKPENLRKDKVCMRRSGASAGSRPLSGSDANKVKSFCVLRFTAADFRELLTRPCLFQCSRQSLFV